MNYCIPCRRPLNGTVTCPECGAYEPETVPANEGNDSAPAADTAALDRLFSEGPGSSEPTDVSSSPTVEVPATRRRCSPRLKKYGSRTLAAATFAMLGSLATALLLPQQSAGTPGAAPSPEQASPDEPDVRVTEPPRASRSPERAAAPPARVDVGDRNGTGRRPRATATERDSPTPRAPAATIGPPPPVKARPTPRPSSGRPSKPASSPSATPPPSPPSSPSPPSASPTSSPLPSTTGVPETDGQARS
ncbi:hypothetical protein QFZ68_000273 [Streptomyces sp. V1I6]|nr:hypothetical protein [Streptomyces sp. V1I6]